MSSLRRRACQVLGAAVALATLVQLFAVAIIVERESGARADKYLQRVAQAVAASQGQSTIISAEVEPGLRVTVARTANVPPALSPSVRPTGSGRLHESGSNWRTWTTRMPSGYVEVEQNIAVWRHRAMIAVINTMWPVALVAILLLALLPWLLRSALSPLTGINAELSRRGAGSVEPLCDIVPTEEVEPILTTFNILCGRFNRLSAMQSGFISNAARALHVPITALRIQIQTLARARDSTARAQAILALVSAIEDTARTVDQLTALAHQDALSQTKPKLERIDLGRCIVDAVHQAAESAARRDVEIALGALVDAHIAGDVSSAMALLLNLLDNAVRYTAAHGTVRVDLHVKAELVVLSITDSGPGVAPVDIGHLTERFYRGHDAMVMGSGLGLSIVETIAHRLGATLKLSNANASGLSVTVEFPKA